MYSSMLDPSLMISIQDVELSLRDRDMGREAKRPNLAPGSWQDPVALSHLAARRLSSPYSHLSFDLTCPTFVLIIPIYLLFIVSRLYNILIMHLTALAPLAAFFALTLAQSNENPFNIPEGFALTAGKPTTLTWKPTTPGTVTLNLREGSSNDLETVQVIQGKDTRLA